MNLESSTTLNCEERVRPSNVIITPRRRSHSIGLSPSRPRTPTHRLIETAVGVKEVQKNIGRAKVRCEDPQIVMIVTKLNDSSLISLTRELVCWIIDTIVTKKGEPVQIYVGEQLREHPNFNYSKLASSSTNYASQIMFWNEEFCKQNPDLVDFIITLGGDGTVLYTSWLFQDIVPPVVPFHLGSLGFLTIFDFTKYKPLLREIFENGVRVNLRMRFTCTVFSQSRADDNSTVPTNSCSNSNSSPNFTSTPNFNSTSNCNSIHTYPFQPDRTSRRNDNSSSEILNTDCEIIQQSSITGIVDLPLNTLNLNCLDSTSSLNSNDFSAIDQTDKANLVYQRYDRRIDSISALDTDHDLVEEVAASSIPLLPKNRSTDTAPSTRHSQRRKSRKRIFTKESFEVLNELVVDRGPSAYMSQLEVFGDERHLTTVQADGLVISTPTGSTAYSLSAGGSIVHPEVSALLVTPICPHTLSFRPMLLPDWIELKVCVPASSRNTAWASFDGRHRIELKQGDFISITASRFPFPTVCLSDQSSDWFHSLVRCLKWNERQRQKPFSEKIGKGEGEDYEIDDENEDLDWEESVEKQQDEVSLDGN